MRPVSDADAPSVDPGVLTRLRVLDRQLRVTWHKFAIDALTFRVIETTGKMDPETGERITGPVLAPSYYLWREDEGTGRYYLVATYPHFGQEVVARLERDVGRFIDPKHILSHITKAQDEVRQRRVAARRDLQAEKIKANQSRIHDLVFDGKHGRRQAKIVSAPGLARGTPGEVRTDAREDGWELPER